jgi:hypothetical protein
MVRRNKNKIGGKVSATQNRRRVIPIISNPISVKNTMRIPLADNKSNAKTDFYNKFCNNKVQQNLVNAMNILLKNMAKSKNKKEQAFVKSLKENENMLAFLNLNKGTNTLSMTMNGGADGDDEPNGAESKCTNSNVVSVVRNTPPVNTTGLSAIQQQITRLNEALSRVEPGSERAVSLVNQLQNLSMIETMTRQRQQAIDIVQTRENWNMAGDVCNRLTQLVFTGLSGYLAYLVLALVQNAGALITGAAGGLLSLFVIVIIDTIGSVVNGVSGSMPSWLGGGNLMASGREIVEGMTDALEQGIDDTPELSNIMFQLRELGYTSNIIAFIILFIVFNIIAHMSRIFMTSNQFSVGFTGILVSRNVQPQALPAPEQSQTPALPAPTQTETPAIENVEETPALEDEGKEVNGGGYKSRKRRRRRKKHKSRKHAKKRKTRKGKKAKKKMRKTRKR